MRIKYGYLTIIGEPVRVRIKNQNRIIVKCICRCGKEKNYFLHNLKAKVSPTRSCGCRKREGKIRKHGLVNHPLYKVWSAAKDRCNNPKNKDYKDYGGRGIKMCVSWQKSFKRFYNWCIKNGYAPKLELDRENNNDGYRPKNCRFVSHAVNLSNRRKYQKKPTSAQEIESQDWSQIPVEETENENYF
jgi:hypothetical protein